MRKASRTLQCVLALFLAACVPAACGDAAPAAVSIPRLVETAERMINRQEYADALATLERAMEADPTYIPIWLQYARANMALSNHKEADEALNVCLMRNPGDVDANLLKLLNILQWRGIADGDKAARLSDAMRTMEPDTFDRSMAELIARSDLPDMIPALLTGWRRATSPANPAAIALSLYETNRPAAAERALAAARDVPPEVAEALQKLFVAAQVDGGAGAWLVERGELKWTGGGFILETPPGALAMVWHRLSHGWKNVRLTVNIESPWKSQRDVYLRYLSPVSYLRLSFTRDALLVQERLPDPGLVTIYSHPLTMLRGGTLEVLLRGDRFCLFDDGGPLFDNSIAVTPSVLQGSVVFASDNRQSSEPLSAAFSVSAVSLPEAWTVADAAAAADRDGERAMSGADSTGIVVPMTMTASPGDLGQVLMRSANHGLRTYALFPAGETAVGEIYVPLAGLPSILARRLWAGVVFDIGEGSDRAAVADAIVAARGAGLQTGVLVDGAAAGGGGWRDLAFAADWILCGDMAQWPESALDELRGYHGGILFGSGDGTNFSAVNMAMREGGGQ